MGSKNRSLFNVKGRDGAGKKIPWRGMIRVDSRDHAVFGPEDDPEKALLWGSRAGIRNVWNGQLGGHMDAKEDSAGRTGLTKFFHRYAPASDTLGSIPGKPKNDPDSYARDVANAIAVDPDSALVLFKPGGEPVNRDVLFKFLRAVAIRECGKFGRDEFTRPHFLAALDLFLSTR